MFKVDFMVDYKKLGDALRALAGLIRGSRINGSLSASIKRKSNDATMNPYGTWSDERAIADT